MSKRLGFILVTLLIVPMLLTACDSKSPEKAEDYLNAVLKGDVPAAQALACDEEFAAKTEALSNAYSNRFDGMVIDKDTVDLKFDIGKGMNNKEIIVTGSFLYVLAQENEQEVAEEVDTAIEIKYELSGEEETRIVLIMEQDGDDWCVTGESEFGRIESRLAEAE